MPNHSVEKWCRELMVGEPPSPKSSEHLSHAEQIEMINEKVLSKAIAHPSKTGGVSTVRQGWAVTPPDVVGGDRVPARDESD